MAPEASSLRGSPSEVEGQPSGGYALGDQRTGTPPLPPIGSRAYHEEPRFAWLQECLGCPILLEDLESRSLARIGPRWSNVKTALILWQAHGCPYSEEFLLSLVPDRTAEETELIRDVLKPWAKVVVDWDSFEANVKDQAPAERRLPASACSLFWLLMRISSCPYPCSMSHLSQS